MGEAAQVIPLDERIRNSKRASAVVRAWEVAKALEGNREQIEGLQWVEPERIEGKGITRKIDFASEFPEGINYLMPVPMDLSVVAPASLLVPGEDIQAFWTMPLLTRMVQTNYSLDGSVRSHMGLDSFSSLTLRNTIDVVSFLPFPKADAPEEERFKPEFAVTLEIRAGLGKPTDYFAAVAKYGNKVIKQFVTGGLPNYVVVLADPKTQTHFSADMLVNLSKEELASTPEDAGVLEIYVYRVTEGGLKIKDIKDVYLPQSLSDKGLGQDFSPKRFSGGRDLFFSSAGPTKGLSERSLTPLPSLPRTEKTPVYNVPKQVGDVKVGEGTRGEEVKYETLEGYGYDSGFAIQPIRIRLLGVREASEEAAKKALQNMAAQYK